MSTKLQFFSGSKHMPAGEGSGECNELGTTFKRLNRHEHWRRVLSNFHVFPFEWANSGEKYRFNSIEHAFQYGKIALVDKDAAYSFTLDSGSELGLGSGLDARNARKMVLLNKEQIKEWGLISRSVMESASRAKYEQCKLARKILKSTKNAELWHHVTRSKPERFVHLEVIRSEYSE